MFTPTTILVMHVGLGGVDRHRTSQIQKPLHTEIVLITNKWLHLPWAMAVGVEIHREARSLLRLRTYYLNKLGTTGSARIQQQLTARQRELRARACAFEEINQLAPRCMHLTGRLRRIYVHAWLLIPPSQNTFPSNGSV